MSFTQNNSWYLLVPLDSSLDELLQAWTRCCCVNVLRSFKRFVMRFLPWSKVQGRLPARSLLGCGWDAFSSCFCFFWSCLLKRCCYIFKDFFGTGFNFNVQWFADWKGCPLCCTHTHTHLFWRLHAWIFVHCSLCWCFLVTIFQRRPWAMYTKRPAFGGSVRRCPRWVTMGSAEVVTEGAGRDNAPWLR